MVETYTHVLIYDIRYSPTGKQLTRMAEVLRKNREVISRQIEGIIIPPSVIYHAVPDSQFNSYEELRAILAEYIPDETDCNAWEFSFLIVEHNADAP